MKEEQTTKRKLEDDQDSSSEESSDDDIVGPSMSDVLPKAVSKSSETKKPKIEQEHHVEKFDLPFDKDYTYSYVLNDRITALSQATADKFLLITGSQNGFVQFWRRKEKSDNSKETSMRSDTNQDTGGIEIVSEICAHPGKEISLLLLDSLTSKLASIAKDDKLCNIYDLNTLDMIQRIPLTFIPDTSRFNLGCWFTKDMNSYLILSEKDACTIHIINPEDEEEHSTKQIHKQPTSIILPNLQHDCIVSFDKRGMIEYWNPFTDEHPSRLKFRFKTETDLMVFVKQKTPVDTAVLDTSESKLVAYSSISHSIKIFDFETGKLETTLMLEVSEITDDRNCPTTMIYDSNNDLIYLSYGNYISVLDIKSGSSVFKLGESCIPRDQPISRFVISKQFSFKRFDIDMVVSKNEILESELEKESTLFAITSNGHNLMSFDRTNPKLTTVDLKGKTWTRQKTKTVQTNFPVVVLHTSLGDIRVKLFNDAASKTAENFITLCKRNFYDNITFHRVIKDFMIQSGDPTGDGTGGISAWNNHFEDEFSASLNHSRPYMLSMANSGPNTNGSQFFITTTSTPWLDNKHTVFGEVIDGHDTVKAIEGSETDRNDKPVNQIIILSTSIESE
ncbi:Piso0_000317 [Millerozyma farinosa CBS 7064]|uniref:peptidylprolyl isomerase n=1 Tax=Pichia sorbitophila (strain ATCC MYA-4447 / BCRC 22081 / CBS 7064 / NBRC 10061 / NRRL Y-12695) TaxID=559304 RepID=G8YTN5_PICSO|nr:Piso0_000317 [Millerozyma farinosa CBS 7064]